MLKEEFRQDLELVKSGQNFLGILNDIKRRPEDAANELNVPLEEIDAIISGKKPIPHEIIEKAAKIWPVNARDFFIIRDDCPIGVKIMTAEESKKTSRIMNRAGKPYYEYRDTAMSTTAPLRPEWILELCYVDDNDPSNSAVQWNNGHFMHQFTYFIGEVNFYYRSQNGEKKVAVMNTGDSMYITPFTPHTFTTRKGAKQNGLILALTYGSKLTGDIQQEMSALSVSLGSEFALDFSTKQNATASLIQFHRDIANLSLDEMSKRTGILKSQLEEFEKAINIPTMNQIEKIAQSIGVNQNGYTLQGIYNNDSQISAPTVIQDKAGNYNTSTSTYTLPVEIRSNEFLEVSYDINYEDRKSTRLNSSHTDISRMPSSA